MVSFKSFLDTGRFFLSVVSSTKVFFWLSYFLTRIPCYTICDALRDFVQFVQFKKREKHPWKSVNFSKIADFIYPLKTSEKLLFSDVFRGYVKPATLLKSTLLHGCFSCSLNCTNGTKLRNAPQLRGVSGCWFLVDEVVLYIH